MSTRKLTDEKIRDIKRRLVAGETGKYIASLHLISMTQISLIKSGSRYAKVKI